MLENVLESFFYFTFFGLRTKLFVEKRRHTHTHTHAFLSLTFNTSRKTVDRRRP